MNLRDEGMKMTVRFVLCISGLLLGTVVAQSARGQTSRPVSQSGMDDGYGPPESVCTLRDARIHEASGLIASRKMPGCYYTLNDSDNPPLVFLIDRAGRTRLTLRLADARNVDWEDIALAPGEKPGTFDVCVADIGDNNKRRRELTIYRFPEPSPPETPAAPASQPANHNHEKESSGSSAEPLDAPAETKEVKEIKAVAYRIRYADGPSDAEAFFVHPRTGDGYIVTKRFDGRCDVYKLAAPWKTNELNVLPKVGELRFPDALPVSTMATAADLAPDGRRLAVRSYACGWEWRLPAETPDKEFEKIFKTEPTRLELAAEPQGEALCYSSDGRAILTVSEKRPTVLYETQRKEGQFDPKP